MYDFFVYVAFVFVCILIPKSSKEFQCYKLVSGSVLTLLVLYMLKLEAVVGGLQI